MFQEEIKKEGMVDPNSTKLKVMFAGASETPEEELVEAKGISFFKDEDADLKNNKTV
jgi:hypothetical protein